MESQEVQGRKSRTMSFVMMSDSVVIEPEHICLREHPLKRKWRAVTLYGRLYIKKLVLIVILRCESMAAEH